MCLGCMEIMRVSGGQMQLKVVISRICEDYGYKYTPLSPSLGRQPIIICVVMDGWESSMGVNVQNVAARRMPATYYEVVVTESRAYFAKRSSKVISLNKLQITELTTYDEI